MALQQVLGILGKAIVADASPEEVRRIILETPGLSGEERADLLRIPHARLRPYQHDYYTVETNMVRWGFERTWRCLQLLHFGVQPNGSTPERAFMVRFRNHYPNRTHSVRELGRHFVRFLGEDCSELSERAPWLGDLAEAERLEIESLYAEDHPRGVHLEPEAWESFLGGSMESLLELRVVRADGMYAHAFAYDILALKSAVDALDDKAFRIEDRANTSRRKPARNPLVENTPGKVPLPKGVAESSRSGDVLKRTSVRPVFEDKAFTPRATHLVIARDPATLTPRWHRSDLAGLALLGHTSSGTPVTVEELLAAWCGILESIDAVPEDDATLLRGFLERMHYAMAHRHILRYSA